jgi:multiple sugar transport system substrate-binding protein
MKTHRISRLATVALAATSLVLGLAACGGDSGSGGSTGGDAGPVTIRFSWWGAETRNARVQEAIDIFESEHPDIHVQGEFAEWSGYWDKLATAIAGGDTPDVFFQEDRYIGDYARRGILADLGALGVDTSQIDSGLLGSGRIDGTLVGIPTGSNVLAVLVNPAIFELAGVPMPDDDTWTWEDYVDISVAIHNGIASGDVYGTSDYTYSEVGFEVFLRQHGQSLFDADGNLNYDDALLVQWWNRSLELQALGGQPPADAAASLDLLDSPIAKGYGAMSITWSAQMGTLSTAVGDNLQILKMPGETEYSRTGMYFKPGMYMSAAADTDYPEAAAAFIDFFVNDPRVGQIFLTELGLPGNSEVREAIMPELVVADARGAEFVASLNDHVVDARTVLPDGAGQAASIIQRLNEEVLFLRLTPEQAAAQFRTELEAAIS